MSLADKKTVGGPFENDSYQVRVEYDFATDGGAVADYDVLESNGACIVEFKYLIVETAVTSGGSLVLDLGKGDGGTEFLSNEAVAGLTAEAIIAPTAENRFVELTDGEKIALGIEVAAATAGKVHFVFEIRKKPF